MNRRLISEVKLVRRLLALTVLLGVAAGVLIIVQALLLTGIVSRVFLHGSSLTQVWSSLWWLLGAILLRAVFGWISEVVALRAAIRVKEQLRVQLVKHLFRLGPAFLHGEESGELLNTAFEGIEQLEPYLARYLPQVSLSALIPLAILAVTLQRDLLSAVIMMVTAPVIVVFMILIGKMAQAVADKQWRSMSILSAHFFDVLRGIRTLKMFNRGKFQASIIERMSEEYRKTTMGTLRVAFLSSWVLELMATLGTAMIAVAIGLRLLAGHLSFTDGLVVLVLAPEFYAPIRALGTQYHASINGVTAVHRILDLLSTRPLGLDLDPADVGGVTGVPDTTHSKSLHIEFHEVGFLYRASSPINRPLGPQADECVHRQMDDLVHDHVGRPGVSDLSFTLNEGERVAIVGVTGSGKSTIINLLLGFLRPTSGIITVSGIPFEKLDLKWWREQIAYVPQTSHLFHGSIADNLRLAKPGASLAELIAACKLASADEFIERLPERYESRVGELGAGLSGGQIQRIALARAFLKNCPILVLDEPTAHLDIANELAVEQALHQLGDGRTALIVAHRLSTIYSADKILVLENGILTGQGSHVELLQNHSGYQRLLQAYSGKERQSFTAANQGVLESQPAYSFKSPRREPR